ncbi:MAG: UPF0104 family protein, partial [Elusimicrobiota bacterium]
MSRRRRVLSILLALSCTGFFLWLALHQVDFAGLGRALAVARWIWVIPMAAIILLDLVVRAV